MKRILYTVFLFLLFLGNAAIAQHSFSVLNGIPHLAVVDQNSISSPKTGMLIYSNVQAKPLIYNGSTWETLCTNTMQMVSPEDYFMVKAGISYLPVLAKDPIRSITPGTIYFSSIHKSAMIYNGAAWVKIQDLSKSVFTPSTGFMAGAEAQTFKLPVLSADPAILSVQTGAFYLNASSRTLRYFDGVVWQDIRCMAEVLTLDVTAIKGTTALANGEVISNAGSDVTTRGFCWSINPNPDISLNTKTVSTVTGGGLGAFSGTLSNLLQNTTYHVRAYATNSQGTVYGEDKVFTTLFDLATIITLDLNNITSIDALSGGDITDDGGSPVSARGIRWSIKGDPLEDKDAILTNDGSGVGVFPSSLVGLLGNTTYYVRAYAVNTMGIAYGNLLSFTTPPPVPPALSSATVTVTHITDKSAKGEVNILNNGGALVSARGFAWSTDRITWIHGTSETINPTDIGLYIGNLTNLAPGTTYFAKGYATNSAGTAYTSETSFITNSLALITTVKPNNLTGISAYSGGQISHNGGVQITARGICWSSSPAPTIALPTKTEQSFSGDGSGGYNSLIKDLVPATTYYVRAYAINAVGVAYGNEEEFRTPDYPTLSTLAAGSFFNNTAKGGGEVLKDGDAPILARGVVWNLLENPSLSNSPSSSNGSGLGVFSSTMTGLEPNAVYHVRAYATNVVGTSYGADKTFSLIPGIPEVSTQPVIAITNMTATGGGIITSNGDADITAKGIYWSKTGDPGDDLEAGQTKDGPGAGTYQSFLGNLYGNTLYYVRAYAENRFGKAYGDLLTFVTPAPQLPTLAAQNLSITNIKDTQAHGLVYIQNNGGGKILSKGIAYSTDKITYLQQEAIESGDVGGFNVQLEGLLPGTVYYAKGYATNSAGTVYTREMSFITPLYISINTLPVTQISSFTAVTGGQILNPGSSGISFRGLAYGTSPSPTIWGTVVSNGETGEQYSSYLNGLTGSTRYYVRAYAGNGVATVYGNEETFMTAPAVLPAIRTLNIENIGGVTATARVEISNDGGSFVSSRGICWSTNKDPEITDGHKVSGTGKGIFTAGMEDLLPLTKYYVRAYAINEVGIVYGNELTFTTATIATLTTLPATLITANTASGGGNISADGGTPVLQSGLCWSTAGLPTTADAHTTGAAGIGSFVQEINELLGSTTYFVRAYAINSAGTAYGNVQQFVTAPPVLATISTTTATSGTEGLTAISGGTIYSNGGAVITDRGLVWSTQKGFDPADPNTKISNSFGAGSFVMTMNSLLPGTVYYVRAFATNSAGTAYAANEIEFTTFGFPELNTSAIPVNTLTSMTAVAGGTITSNGGTPVTSSGVCWSTRPLPTINDGYVGNGKGMGDFVSPIAGLLGNTTYYVRAYAMNSVGIAYGEEKSFTTLPPILATLKTNPAVAASTTTANAGGTILTNGGALVTTRGVVWSTDANFNPDTAALNKTSETGYFTGSFTTRITGLKQHKVYYVRAYVTNSVGTTYGDVVNFMTPQLPVLTTAFSKGTGSTTAISGGVITDEGGSNVYARGVVYSPVAIFNPDTITVNRTTNESGIGAFESPLKNLKANTTYYVQAYARNVAGTTYANLLNFTTDPPVLAQLTTRAAVAITGSTAISGGDIFDDGGAAPTTRGMVWSTQSGFRPDTVIQQKTVQAGLGKGGFSSAIPGLKAGTTYYMRAYAINSVGTAYGNELSFTTLIVPTLTTAEVTVSSAGITAIGGGTIISDGAANISNQGVVWSTTPNPMVGTPNETRNDTGPGNTFRSNLTGLEPITLYYVRAYAVNSEGTAYGNEVTFTTPAILPTLSTSYATASSKSTATTGGLITKDGGAAVTERGVVWSADRNFNPDAELINKTADGFGMGAFSSEMTGLKLSTAYFIRAYAKNSIGTAYGNQVTVTLFPTAPILSTTVVTELGGYTANSGGVITSDGGADVTQKGLVWSIRSNPTINDSKTANGPGQDTYTGIMTGLIPNTLYYVRAYAQNKIGTAYGVERTFLTNALPTLTVTTAVTNVIATTATSGGDITDDGRSPILVRGVTWNTTGEPTLEKSAKTIDKTTTGIGKFEAFLTGLTGETTYYIRAYATNAVGTTYGSQISFVTKPVMLPTLQTNSPTLIGSSTVTGGGNVIDDGGMPVTQRGICWSTSPNPTTALTTRLNHATGGTGDFPIPVTGLTPGTKYYIRAFAINIKGTAYGEELSFVTLAIPPTVGMAIVSNVLGNSVDLTAALTNNGGDEITDRGFYYSKVSKMPGLPLNPDSMVSVGPNGAFAGTLDGLISGGKYYIWAYASNSMGTGLSTAPTITTTKTIPVLSTTKPYNVLKTGATSGAAAFMDGGSAVTARGTIWSTTKNLTIDLPTKTSDGTGVAAFASLLTGLEKRTLYYVRAYATNAIGTGYGNLDSVTTVDVPVLTTTLVSSIKSTSVIGGGEVLDNGGLPLSNNGICWSTSPNPTYENSSRLVVGTSVGVFSGEMRGLTLATKYYYRAFANNAQGLAYGEEYSFTTLAEMPVVSAVTLTKAQLTSVDGAATITNTGGGGITDRGFYWSTSAKAPVLPLHPDSLLSVGTEGTFNGNIKGLSSGVKYNFWAYVTNAVGTALSAAPTVLNTPALPLVTTTAASAITETTAASGGTVTYAGNLTVTGRGVVWSTEKNPTTALETKVSGGSGMLGFNVSITGLTRGTKYYIRAYATNDMGTAYGNLDSLTTMNVPSLKTSPATEITAAAATAGGEVLTEGGIKATARGLVWSTTNNPTVALTTKTVDGAGTGVFVSKLTGLLPGTLYYFKAYATNTIGTGYGPLDSLKTPLTLASVTKVKIDKTTASAVHLSAQVLSYGGVEVIEQGFVWSSTSKVPTIADQKIIAGGGANFTGVLDQLLENPTYYARAYVITSVGISYSPEVNSFKFCKPFTMTHTAGINGAPVTKTVNYTTVSTDITGTAQCWLTQNLGADRQISSITDFTEPSTGWFWQFNRSQGFKQDGSVRTPNNVVAPWIAVIDEKGDWLPENDPCDVLLGGGWRLPTATEWTNADGPPQNWNTIEDTYNSVLKLNTTGYSDGSSVQMQGRFGYFWSSTAQANNVGKAMISSATASVMDLAKAYAFSVRCLRDSILLAKPRVGLVTVPVSGMKVSSAEATATMISDAGLPVLERGFVWSTKNTVPDLKDNKVLGSNLQAFTAILAGLVEGPTIYVRAYATNVNGTGYSREATSFKVCNPITISHIAGLNGAPVSKTVTYGTVSSSMSGAPRCWTTQNLGADRQPTTISDYSEPATGWLWQFNRSQGYKIEGTVRTPDNNIKPWNATINENSDWLPENDPCDLLLGGGWRLPTATEWTNADGPPQNWNTVTDTYNSPLKLISSGYTVGAAMQYQGTNGYFWSSNMSAVDMGRLMVTGGTPQVMNLNKNYAFSVRCIRDTIALTKPKLSMVSIPVSGMKEASAEATAILTSTGGLAVTATGFVWSTTNMKPDLSDQKLAVTADLETLSGNLTGLSEGPTIYVRAFATNANGTGYSPEAASFKICNPVTAIHVAGLNGAAVDKKVVYGTVSSSVSGAPRCWITQNLGADRQAISAADNTEAASGWYFQFNRKQGYKLEGAIRTPSNSWTPWISAINEIGGWSAEQDPCVSLLGAGWRLPSATEMSTMIAAPQSWKSQADIYNSALKIHMAGSVTAGGSFAGRGSTFTYWTSTAGANTTTGKFLYWNGALQVADNNKAEAMPVRCLRDEITAALPAVSNVLVPASGMTSNSAAAAATVSMAGTAAVTERGLVWSTSNKMPTTADQKIKDSGNGTGDFNVAMNGLSEEFSYYVRAYAQSSVGIVYSPEATTFKICNPFTVIHKAGFNGAPVDKTVTYKTISSTVTGAARCWITQNLGAAQQATAFNDATAESAGWYWQFNQVQGYEQNTTDRIPAALSYAPWQIKISSNSDWLPANDPCRLLLGGGWRMPTAAEWTAADAAPQNWTKDLEAYQSDLKLHNAGYLDYNTGLKGTTRGTAGRYWSSNQFSYPSDPIYGVPLQFTAGNSLVNQGAFSETYKSFGYSIRCLRDAVEASLPVLTPVSIPVSGMKESSAEGSATVVANGGSPISAKGLVWSTTNPNPDLNDQVLSVPGNTTGDFKSTITGLAEGPTIYVRAYASNANGTGYSAQTTSFKICNPVTAIHVAGLNGAAVDKTVVYGTVSSSLSGAPRCWITQNLGADLQAISVSDNTEAASGWYFQFNRKQGYKMEGATRTPSNAWTPWISAINEIGGWSAEQDPCVSLLGSGWRLPTATEMSTVVAIPQAWKATSEIYNSVLKMHMGGYVTAGGSFTGRGTSMYYWTSTAGATTTTGKMFFWNGSLQVIDDSKAGAMPVRCLRDELTATLPAVSNVVIPASGIINNSAAAKATVSRAGTAAVTERGLVWSTSNKMPTNVDQKIKDSGNGTGDFNLSMNGLSEEFSYYVRAYAQSSVGIVYSEEASTFKVCNPLTVIHRAGFNGAAVDKTVTYKTISSTVTGAARCWITQNLGAAQEAAAFNDATPESAGWYWQFNQVQGYEQNTTDRIPAAPSYAPWQIKISSNSDWLPANDPCRLLLGGGWRMPTAAEWTAADAPPQNWTKDQEAYQSALKLHNAGYLEYNTGLKGTTRGTAGRFWSSNQFSYPSDPVYGIPLQFTAGNSLVNQGAFSETYKSFGYSIRCLRDAVETTVPVLTPVSIPVSGMKESSAEGSATVVANGGSPISAKGLVWSTTNPLPDLNDNVLPVTGNTTGDFNSTLSGLSEGPTIYVRAYASNTNGTGYSAQTTSFKICNPVTAIHVGGLNGAAVDKTVVYGTVSSSLSGAPRCWITQNLGADRQAISVSDNTEAASGWYFQFNRKQGYKMEGAIRTPSNAWTPWISAINEAGGWSAEQDPCVSLLGSGWRLPTATEMSTVVAIPQAWKATSEIYNSVLKMHMGGYVTAGGSFTGRGTSMYYWTSTAGANTTTAKMFFWNGSLQVVDDNKAGAMPVRCLRDELTATLPAVSNVVLPASGMINNSAIAKATVSMAGTAAVTERGLVWSTSNKMPTTADQKIKDGSNGAGDFSLSMNGLSEEYSYYVRAYAQSSLGIVYSEEASTFKVCNPVTMIHKAGFNGAPVDKTVTYKTVSSTVSGAARCWITQNLGATQEAAAFSDATPESAGWYWQFNQVQGYEQNTTDRIPAATSWAPWQIKVSLNSDWLPANDPCRLLLGGGWRMPTAAEWIAADAPPQNWTRDQEAYQSALKLHNAGYLDYNTGVKGTTRGASGRYWSSSQFSYPSDPVYGLLLQFTAGNSLVNPGPLSENYKSFGYSVRCLRDAVEATVPVLTSLSVPVSGMKESSAEASATVVANGGSAISAKGLVWSTTNPLPDLSENVLPVTGNTTGDFNSTLTGLPEGITIYSRAYASNSKGTGYSAGVSSFKICNPVSIVHVAGLNGAPVSKTLTYGTVSSNLSGAARCWITQNLGADRQATNVADNTEAASGWYWQFNRKSGYKHDGTTRTPATAWLTAINEAGDWTAANDPCTALMGSGWRLPTATEMSSVIAPPQAWTTLDHIYNSPLKIHMAGSILAAGNHVWRVNSLYYWTGTTGTNIAGKMFHWNGVLQVVDNTKAEAMPVRCLK